MIRMRKIAAFRRHPDVPASKVMRLGTQTFVPKLRVGRLHVGVVE